MGERTPHLDPNARAALVGLAASHTRGHVVRAILEGVAFSLRDTFTIFAEMKVPVDNIRLGGGGARSPLWRRDSGRLSYGHPVETRDGRRRRRVRRGAPCRRRLGHLAAVDAACDAWSAPRQRRSTPAADAVAAMTRAVRRLYRRALSGAPRHLSRGDLMPDAFTPRPEHKFSFGLWTVGNRGRDPFGDVVRDRRCRRSTPSQLLGEVGAWGVNLHDNDLVPDRRHARRARSHRQGVQGGLQRPRHRRADGDRQPVLRSGVPRRRVHRQRSARARAYALQKTMRAMDLGAELGATDLRALGRTRGHRDRCVPAAGRGGQAAARGGQLPVRVLDRPAGTDYKFALEAKPNEPRGDIYMADDRRVSRVHPDARSSGDGRRESRKSRTSRWPG